MSAPTPRSPQHRMEDILVEQQERKKKAVQLPLKSSLQKKQDLEMATAPRIPPELPSRPQLSPAVLGSRFGLQDHNGSGRCPKKRSGQDIRA